jgi:lantibiotic modifying enzyme
MALLDWLNAMPDTATAQAGDYAAVSAAMGQPCLDVLGGQAFWDNHRFVDESVLIGLRSQLAHRLSLAVWAILELEQGISPGTPSRINVSRDAWIDRLCGFPALMHVVGTIVRNWRLATVELLAHLKSDLALIENELFNDTPLGPLIAIDGDRGDTHDCGRAVAILTFASGARVVYKPKDLRSASGFLELVKGLNQLDPGQMLPSRKVLPRAGYGWEEYVPRSRPAGRLTVCDLFERFGMLLRLLQLLGARDFWLDNLIFDGASPVFVDLECILHPSVEGHGGESVLATGAVTELAVGPQGTLCDVGALSGPGWRCLPVGRWPQAPDRFDGEFALQGGYLFWNPDPDWPYIDNRPAEAAEFLDQLESGYRRMQDTLCRNQSELFGADAAFACLTELPVRAIVRSTWEYLVALRGSLEPTALLSGASREVALARLFAAPAIVSDGTDAQIAARIAWAEVSALTRLDIPRFGSVPNSKSLFLPEGGEIPNVFERSAAERLARALGNVADFDVDSQVATMRSAIEAMSFERRPSLITTPTPEFA